MSKEIAEQENELTWASGFAVVVQKVEPANLSISPGSKQPISSTSESFLHHPITLSHHPGVEESQLTRPCQFRRNPLKVE